MDEARRLLARIDRIEGLARGPRERDEGAWRRTRETLLPELRALVVEAEAWARREEGAGAYAGSAIDALRQAVDRTPSAREPPGNGLASAPAAKS